VSARRRRAGLALALLVVGVNVVAALLGSYLAEPGGTPWSSYATGAEGLAAYAALLERDGRTVSAAREEPSAREPDPRTTLVLVEPPAVAASNARALRKFLQRGGRLVLGDRDPGPWLRALVNHPPRWSRATVARAAALAPVPEAGAGPVRPGGPGAWTRAGATLPVLGGQPGALVTVAAVGRGRLVLLADPSPLANRRLALEANAALGLALVGEARRPVAFAEWAHGYGAATGLRALPARWRLALAGLGVAALALVLARGRRYGPVEAEARELPPPRSDYARALGAALARTGRPAEAAAPVRAEARRLLGLRGAEPGADPRAAAAEAGLSPEEARAVLDGVHGPEGVLAAGRALARLAGGSRG
jgi:hypothetical protein